jgi:hypothetical protein
MDDADYLDNVSRQTPNKSGTWGSITATIDPEEAEYIIVLNRPTMQVNADRMLLFSAEPPIFRPEWSDIDALRKYPVSDLYFPQIWWISKSYDELVSMDPLDKTGLLSWITSSKGKGRRSFVNRVRKIFVRIGIDEHRRRRIPLIRGPSDGHILRMEFLDRLVSHSPDLLDLYGRGDFSGPYYLGEVEDKWNGLHPYRYSLVVENYSGENYFSEKLTDALLSWCMPIYWGCTNLEEFIPEDSFVDIDIENPDAPKRVEAIVRSDIREQNLDAIAEAREKLINEYQLWPTVERAINRL